jgi:hypothetical protein
VWTASWDRSIHVWYVPRDYDIQGQFVAQDALQHFTTSTELATKNFTLPSPSHQTNSSSSKILSQQTSSSSDPNESLVVTPSQQHQTNPSTDNVENIRKVDYLTFRGMK